MSLEMTVGISSDGKIGPGGAVSPGRALSPGCDDEPSAARAKRGSSPRREVESRLLMIQPTALFAPAQDCPGTVEYR